jgi:redox-sensitive bicupin YhaK (pirin superfamily)
MPAVTVDELTVLPSVRRPDPATTTWRPVRSVTTAPRGFEGEGFPVRRAFAGVALEDLDPFIHLDQMGEVDYGAGEPKGTPWHPHRGFETVTYMIDGVIQHQDSNGGGGTITDGDTQWMTAGQGILHIETPPEEVVIKGGLFHGLQLWVNLPREQKWAPPRYQDLGRDDVALLSSHDGGALLRLIAGDLDGIRGPGTTYTPITMVHASVSPEAEVAIPWPPRFNALVYVLAGRGSVGTDRRPIRTGQLAVLGAGDGITLTADAGSQEAGRHLEVILLGGQPIREPIAWAGPFVMNSEDEVRQAFDDFRRGRLGTVPAVHNAPTDLLVTETDSPLD